MRLSVICVFAVVLSVAAAGAQVVTILEGGYPGIGVPGGQLSRDGTVLAGGVPPNVFCDPQTLPPFTMRADGTGFSTFTIPGGSTGTPSCPRILGAIPSGDGSVLLVPEAVRSFCPFTFDPGPLWIFDTRTGNSFQLAPLALRALISEDGNTVVYYNGLWTVAMNSDGTNRRMLPSGLRPTGTDAIGSKVVGYVHAGGQADAYVVNSDGTGLRNLTNTPGFDEWQVAISSDGTTIAVPRETGGPWPYVWTDVLVVRSDGSGLRTLATLPGGGFFPALNDNGTLLAIDVLGHPAPNPLPGGMFLFDVGTGAVRLHIPSGGPIGAAGSTLTAAGTRMLGGVLTPTGSRLAVIDLALPDLKVLGPERIGATETVQVAAAPGSLFFLAASDRPGSLPVAPFGTLGLDPARISILAHGIIGSTSTFRLPFSVPNDPNLVGFRLHLQALALEPGLIAGSFTNTVEVRLRQ